MSDCVNSLAIAMPLQPIVSITIAKECEENYITVSIPTEVQYLAVQGATIAFTSTFIPDVELFTGQSLITVTHNKGRFPSVTVFDSSGNQIIAQVTHTSLNAFQVSFNTPQSGKINYF